MTHGSGKMNKDPRMAAQQAVRDLRERVSRLGDAEIELILRNARTHYAWTDRAVPDELLREVYAITIAGPTSMNTCPARFVFVRSSAAKERLVKALRPANIDKMMTAPVTAIIAWDPRYWERLDFLFPQEDRRQFFANNEAFANETGFRNATLQGGYFIVAARAVGLDVGAMSGFSNAMVDEEFFADNGWKSNFLCNLGYADETALFQKLPRFAFDDICEII